MLEISIVYNSNHGLQMYMIRTYLSIMGFVPKFYSLEAPNSLYNNSSSLAY